MRIATILLITASLVGCLHVGEASREEKAQLAAWSSVVTEKDRAEVQRVADSHADWMEKKKVQWMTQQYRARYNRAQEKKEKAASKPSTTKAS